MKRLFDIVLSAAGLVVLLPVGGIIALAIRLADGGPAFYRQLRVGQFGKPFRIWKFRSMVREADQAGLPLTCEADVRITPVGRWLRRFKLDELPQLWNVLVGEMSFVGPRPEVPRYVERYTAEQREILRDKPGITDLASMLFRNEQELLAGAVDVEDFYIRHCLPRKITQNLEYARAASLPHDLWIILQTLCPYWLGVLAMHAAILVSSLWIAFELHTDFQMDEVTRADFWRCLPWVVVPQLAVLFWRRQCRGLVSYFSFLELLQTGLALSIASVFLLALKRYGSHAWAPTSGIIVTDLVLSLWGITYARLSLRMIRERQCSNGKANGVKPRGHRVAIVGAGELGTKIALDLLTREQPTEVVAFFDDDPLSWNKRPYDIPVVGMPECLVNSEWSGKVDEVIVALPGQNGARHREIGEIARQVRLKVAFASDWPVLEPAA